MLKQLPLFLNRPFPLIETNREKFSLSLTIGVFIFIFLAVFQPFGLNTLGEEKYFFFLGYGFVSFLTELAFTFGLMNLFKNFYDPQKWTLGKHLINVLFFIISLAFFNWLFTVWLDYPKYNPFLPFLMDTITIGFFPSIFVFIYLERKLRMKNVKLSSEINSIFIKDSRNLHKTMEDKIDFQLKIAGINMEAKDFLFIKSLGNYITLYYLENGKQKKETVRTTMKQIENELGNNKEIIRCHKSYFINLQKVTNSFGNARSLYLQIEGVKTQIPVSRKVAKELSGKIS